MNPAEMAGLHWCEDGYAALSGDLLARMTELDRYLRTKACALGATEHRFPSMIPARSLAPVAYLKSFPHLATFVTSGSREKGSLARLAAEHGSADRIPLSDQYMEPVEQLLTPAACYHFYPRLAGSRLTAPLVLTTACHCHRRETHYVPLRRQWCFTMREIVAIGDAPAIEAFTAACRRCVDELRQRLGLEGGWHTATDPFFDPDSDPKALAQRLEPAKVELRLPDGLAVASLNHHRGFFGECYDIRIGSETAHSACVAFGIERWLYALLETHGPDASAWPYLDPAL